MFSNLCGVCVYLEVEVQDGRHVCALWETLQGQTQRLLSHLLLLHHKLLLLHLEVSTPQVKQRLSSASRYLLLLQVVADGKVSVSRLALRLETGAESGSMTQLALYKHNQTVLTELCCVSERVFVQ